MVAAVTSFVQLFKDLGLSMATVQRAEVTGGQVNALFWVNVAVSALATLITALLSPGIAWFYADPRLVPVTLALASGIFLSGLSVQHEALMKRQMRFTAIAVIEVAAVTASVILAIAAAWLGADYWALVVQQLSRVIFATLGAWIACSWRPSRPRWAQGARSMLAFGGHLTGFRLLNYFARNADDILIGRFVGAEALGYYTRAYKLLLAPIELIRNPISNVVIPSLSRLQDKPERFRGYSMRALSIIVFLSMPLITFCFAEADRLVLLALGPQWTEAAAIFRVLAAAAFVQSFNMVTGWSFTSLGQTDRWFKWGILFALLIVTSFIAGLPWGAYGVASGYAIANYLILLPSLWYCFKTSHLRIRDVFSTIWRPAVASISASILTIWVASLLPNNLPLILHVLLSGVIFSLIYLGGWSLLPNGLSFLNWIRNLATELINSQSQPAE
jgi:PST family polysaccharide transporter